MRTVIQRVANAAVRVPADAYESRIGKGLLVLAAFIDEDTDADLEWTARKIAAMPNPAKVRIMGREEEPPSPTRSSINRLSISRLVSGGRYR